MGLCFEHHTPHEPEEGAAPVEHAPLEARPVAQGPHNNEPPPPPAVLAQVQGGLLRESSGLPAFTPFEELLGMGGGAAAAPPPPPVPPTAGDALGVGAVGEAPHPTSSDGREVEEGQRSGGGDIPGKYALHI